MRTAFVALLSVTLLVGCPKDPTRGPATVSVSDIFGPAVGVDVLFQAADGTVLAHLVTDADGEATAEVGKGALGTVAQYQPGTTDERRLTTIAGVEPGDALVLRPPPFNGGELVGWASVTLPGMLAGTDQYAVEMGCTGSTWAYTPDPVSPPIFSTCGTALDAIGIAHSSADGIVGWATATGVPITGTAPDQTAAVSLGAWRTDLGTMALALDRPPASATFVYVALSPRRGGMLWGSAGAGSAAVLEPPTPTSLSLRFARDFWSSARLAIRVAHDSGPDEGVLMVNESPLADRAVDLATAIPPRLSGLTVTEAASGYAASWTRAGADAGLDGTILLAYWFDAGGDHRWRVVLPPDRTAFDFPPLPAELAAFLPEVGTPLQAVSVTSYDVSSARSYGDFRSQDLGLIEDYPAHGDVTVRASSTTAHP